MEAVYNAITRRILAQRTDMLAKHGLDAVMDAIANVTTFVGEINEIGSSDVSCWVMWIEDQLEAA